MQESRATGSWTDVPVRSNDFQAPLGEAGALHESAYALKNLHALVQDWGESLAGSMCYYPANQVTDAEDITTLRWCVRYNAETAEGFLFINNHQRRRAMADHKDVLFTVQVRDKNFTLPAMDVPGGFCGVIPFNLRVGERRMLTTNAQLLCRVGEVPVLYTQDGQPPVLNFDGDAPEVILLTVEEAKYAWRTGEGIAISEACILQEGEGLLAISDHPEISVKLLPGGENKSAKTEAVEVAAVFAEISRDADCAVYRVDLAMCLPSRWTMCCCTWTSPATMPMCIRMAC